VNDDTPPVGGELDIRLLRYFVAVAEDLHFTTAATRLFVAQQALSRDIRKLERRIGRPLFTRTTRRVTLTEDGERLLGPARELVALHDRIWLEMRAPGQHPVVVDLLSEGRLTGPRILDRARADLPHVEFRGRYGGGVGSALDRLRLGEVDIVLGRAAWVDQRPVDDLDVRLIRLEPLAVLLPADHPLAALPAVPLAALRGEVVDANPADTRALEWADLVRQFLALTGARSTPPHVPAIGLEEQGYHLVRQGVPILTAVDHVPVPGGVVRALVDPVPLYPWSLIRRREPDGRGSDALLAAAARLASSEDWLLPAALAGDDYWLPEPEAGTLVSR
jgi:DNA-binding transcriptional LysR family regulator